MSTFLFRRDPAVVERARSKVVGRLPGPSIIAYFEFSPSVAFPDVDDHVFASLGCKGSVVSLCIHFDSARVAGSRPFRQWFLFGERLVEQLNRFLHTPHFPIKL